MDVTSRDVLIKLNKYAEFYDFLSVSLCRLIAIVFGTVLCEKRPIISMGNITLSLSLPVG